MKRRPTVLALAQTLWSVSSAFRPNSNMRLDGRLHLGNCLLNSYRLKSYTHPRWMPNLTCCLRAAKQHLRRSMQRSSKHVSLWHSEQHHHARMVQRRSQLHSSFYCLAIQLPRIITFCEYESEVQQSNPLISHPTAYPQFLIMHASYW